MQINLFKTGLRNFYCRVFLAVVLFSCFFQPPSGVFAMDPVHLRIGFSSKAFFSTPKEDIRIAVQLLSKKLAKKTVESADAKIYNFTSEIEKDIKAGKLDMVILDAEEFVQLRNLASIEPVTSTVIGKSHEMELLLLVRKDSGIDSVKDLKNRSLSLPSQNSHAGVTLHKWLEMLVMKEGFSGSSVFFSNVIETRNASQAIMPVFFKKTDACIVKLQAFEVSSELNPQIFRDLKIIAQISHLAGGVVVLRRDLPENLKQKIKQSLLTLHEDQEGKQMLMLFQLNRLISYLPEYLKGMEAMYAEHRKLKARVLRQ